MLQNGKNIKTSKVQRSIKDPAVQRSIRGQRCKGRSSARGAKVQQRWCVIIAPFITVLVSCAVANSAISIYGIVSRNKIPKPNNNIIIIMHVYIS